MAEENASQTLDVPAEDQGERQINKATPQPRPQKFGGQTMEQPVTDNQMGSAAMTFDRKNQAPATVDIAHDYPWTASKTKREDIPYIILAEHRNTEATLMRQMQFYGKGAVNTGAGVFGAAPTKGILEVYDEIFPDNPTNNKYIFPYFSKSSFDLGTTKWEQMDDIGQSIKDVAGGAADILDQFAITKDIGKMVRTATSFAEAGGAVAMTALKGMYPVVGIFDRPRVFSAHSDRDITVEFPLYNTLNAWDWIKNRSFIYKFMSQNLYIKRDFITGIPPCFYRVHVPGQYFSFASCVTNIKVENLGNQRMMYDSFIIPDAWQVSVTLSEMVMPSLNQFQALINGDAKGRVNVTVGG
jgi:hypothetical protein